MGYTLEVRQDGTTTTLPFESGEINRAVGKMDTLRATTLAPAAEAAGIDEYQDEATLSDADSTIFAGVIVDVATDGGRAELQVDSAERYARDAEPSGPKYNFNDRADSWIVEDAIADVDELSAGTVETVVPNMDARFNWGSPANRLRTIADDADAHVVYRDDKTVDYLAGVGTDHPDSEAIRPDPDGAMTDYRVTKNRGTDNHITHLVALGSGKGASQLSAQVVVDGFDPTTDRAVWAVVSNTEIGTQQALRRWAERVLAERSSPASVTIESGVVLASASDVAIDRLRPGDTARVVIADENIDRRVTVAGFTRTLSNEGDEYDVTFSDEVRRTIPDENTKIRADLERYNRAAADPRTETLLDSLGYVFAASSRGAN